MKFTYKQAPGLSQVGGSQLSVDGASKDCVDWYIQTVYQPHYDRFKDDFGKTILGFFYDEPETHGDWGTELNRVLAEWKVDWKKAYVAYKFELAGEEQVAARYQYLDAFAEAWGRTMYGGIAEWCRRARRASPSGHFMEHGNLYLQPRVLRRRHDAAAEVQRHGRHRRGVRPVRMGQRVSARRALLADAQAGQLDHARLRQAGRHHHGRDLRRPRPGPHLSGDEMVDRPHAGVGRELPDPALVQPAGARRHRLPAVLLQRRLRAALAAVPRVCRLHQPPEPDAHRRPARLPGGPAVPRPERARAARHILPEQISESLQDALYDCDWLPYEVFEKDTQGRPAEPQAARGIATAC